MLAKQAFQIETGNFVSRLTDLIAQTKAKNLN
jgi:hypothetical protein